MEKSQTAKTEQITFEEICEMEPRVLIAFEFAKMIGRKRNQVFCANFVWGNFLEPMISEVIGWSRPRQLKRLKDRRKKWGGKAWGMTAFELIKMDDSELDKDIIHVSGNEDERLNSSYAYDLVFENIYNSLPDCNHTGPACG
jgi:hypothetical protein